MAKTPPKRLAALLAMAYPAIPAWRKLHAMTEPVKPGNIDLKKRPIVRNQDGSISTVRSISFNENGLEVVIPTVMDDGTVVSNKDAIDFYRKYGRHLGMFKTVEEANSFAESLHKDQAALFENRATFMPESVARRVAPLHEIPQAPIEETAENFASSNPNNSYPGADATYGGYGGAQQGLTRRDGPSRNPDVGERLSRFQMPTQEQFDLSLLDPRTRRDAAKVVQYKQKPMYGSK